MQSTCCFENGIKLNGKQTRVLIKVGLLDYILCAANDIMHAAHSAKLKLGKVLPANKLPRPLFGVDEGAVDRVKRPTHFYINP